MPMGRRSSSWSAVIERFPYLVDSISLSGHQPLEFLSDIEILSKLGYDAEAIIQKAGLSQVRQGHRLPS